MVIEATEEDSLLHHIHFHLSHLLLQRSDLCGQHFCKNRAGRVDQNPRQPPLIQNKNFKIITIYALKIFTRLAFDEGVALGADVGPGIRQLEVPQVLHVALHLKKTSRGSRINGKGEKKEKGQKKKVADDWVITRNDPPSKFLPW